MAREKPINAEVPSTGSHGGDDGAAAKAPEPPRRRRPRLPLPLALIGIAVLFAIVFIVAAIVGGGGDGEQAPEPAAPLVGGGGGPSGTPPARSTADLGYPAFATKNTTRVGGPDPAANAAGVALAVFPATDPAQRPAAVVLVDEDDWAGGIAAAALMAAPVRAPVLISARERMPEESVEAIRALDPRGSPATGGAAVLAIGEAGAPAGLTTTRVGRGGPAARAAGVARLRDRLFGRPPAHIVVAPARRPAFAMPAAAWAARSGDPVLLTGPKRLPTATKRALGRHPETPVFVLGPSAAIPSGVLREIATISPSVRRVAGEDPVANAIALARYSDGSFGWNVNDPGHGFVVARTDEPLDAAAAAPLSASGTWGPLLLTGDAGTLPPALRDYLLDVKPGYTDDPTRAFYNHVWVIGDQEAIEVGQQAEIDALAELARIGGKE